MAELKDSGQRREFDSGAVRDIQEGKGRCDLLPFSCIVDWYNYLGDGYRYTPKILSCIHEFITTRKVSAIHSALCTFCIYRSWQIEDAILEVSIHYEDGARKYGPHNWEKGIPDHCYIDSGIRHLMKYTRGDKDEPHDRAFIWNMLGLLYNARYHKDLQDSFHPDEIESKDNTEKWLPPDPLKYNIIK